MPASTFRENYILSPFPKRLSDQIHETMYSTPNAWQLTAYIPKLSGALLTLTRELCESKSGARGQYLAEYLRGSEAQEVFAPPNSEAAKPKLLERWVDQKYVSELSV
jgi:hypothetical protein